MMSIGPQVERWPLTFLAEAKCIEYAIEILPNNIGMLMLISVIDIDIKKSAFSLSPGFQHEALTLVFKIIMCVLQLHKHILARNAIYKCTQEYEALAATALEHIITNLVTKAMDLAKP